MNLIFRHVDKLDYDKNHIELYSQLSVINKENIKREDYDNFIDELDETKKIYIIEHNDKIIATGTFFIEKKLIHNWGKVAHIEDIVVDQNYRNKNIGKYLIENILNEIKIFKCYKTILDCDINNIVFYEKCGFKLVGNEMAIYY
jgi:glucosamine-phosphate N-acetyltransferase